MNTTVRETKDKTIRRTITISYPQAGRCECRVSECDGQRSTLDTYLLERMASDWGAAFAVTKCDETGEQYDVLLDGNRSSCTCHWNTLRPNMFACRHIEMALLAVREGKLPLPAGVEPKREDQRPVSTESDYQIVPDPKGGKGVYLLLPGGRKAWCRSKATAQKRRAAQLREEATGDPKKPTDLYTMKPGAVLYDNGHRIERVASGWRVDEAFASSRRQLSELLAQSEPCKRAPVPADEFEDL